MDSKVECSHTHHPTHQSLASPAASTRGSIPFPGPPLVLCEVEANPRHHFNISFPPPNSTAPWLPRAVSSDAELSHQDSNPDLQDSCLLFVPHPPQSDLLTPSSEPCLRCIHPSISAMTEGHRGVAGALRYQCPHGQGWPELADCGLWPQGASSV